MDNVDSMINAMKDGIDKNSTDAPVISIDPKSNQVSVVGDPNRVESTKGEYSLTFSYPAEALSEEDKTKMKFNEETEEYEARVHYYDKRVKPLYRMTVSMDLADVMSKAEILLQDGSYTTDHISMKTIRIFLDNIETISRIARLVLGVNEDQLKFATPDSLINFFIDMMLNEPNIVKESSAFLEQSYIKQAASSVEKARTETETKTKKTATQQN